MFCGLAKEERTRFKKKEKEKKKPIAAKSGLFGTKWYLKTYNRLKYFLSYLSRFLNETAFYAKLSGRFLGPKTKARSLIASKFGTNMQISNLKLLSKFHEARPNRSRVICKSLKLRTR